MCKNNFLLNCTMAKSKLFNLNLLLMALWLLGSTINGIAQNSNATNQRFFDRGEKDELSRFYITPKRVVWISDADGDAVVNADVLLKKGTSQAYFGIPKKEVCKLKNRPDKRAAFILDFGSELHGGIQITTSSSNRITPKVRICFGESVSEAMSDVYGVNASNGGATNHHAMRDFEVTLPGYGTLEIGNTGFRFVRIELVDSTIKELALKEVRAINVIRDIPYLGYFKSNDTLLNSIWQTGAYTVHLNMQNYLLDGIKRDRMVWMGDMHPEIMTINAVFGPQTIIPKSLDFCKNTTPLPKWINGISSYSLWWIIAQHDWYMYSGDMDYLKAQKGYLNGLMKQLFTQIDEKGREKLGGKMRFLDWPSSENDAAVHAGLHALMIIALENGSRLCALIGDESLAAEAKTAAGKMRSYVPDMADSKQAAALLSIADIVKPKKADKKVIAVGGVKNFSTFYGYYMLQARAKAGEYKGALDNIREFWGVMLKLGATSFWEDFNIEWVENAAGITEIVPDGKRDIHKDFGAFCYKNLRHSLCHGWASGPTAWLSEHVLGVKPLEPGCSKVLVQPHLGDLEWVEGAYPTPMGLIKVRHEKQKDGTVKSTINAPEGIEIIQ